MQISPEYLLRLRRKPQPDDDYSKEILQWREMGFTTIPGTRVPLDNINVLSAEGRKAWVKSRYCDWHLLEKRPGAPEWNNALEAAKKARGEFEAALDSTPAAHDAADMLANAASGLLADEDDGDGADGSSGAGVERASSGGSGHGFVDAEQLGFGTSGYYGLYLNETTDPTLQEMVSFVLSVRYQHYTMNRRKTSADGGWRLIQPKYEYWTTIVIDGIEHRPVYYLKEGTEFYHAGERAPPVVQRYLDKLNRDFKLEGRNKLNSLMLIIDDKGWHHAPPHADGHRTGGFYDLSLSSPGYARELQLLAPDSEPDWGKVSESQVLGRKVLAHSSLAVISPEDNGYTDAEGVQHPPKVKHGVPPDEAQPADAWRISAVARAITPHPNGQMSGEHFRPIDAAAAARVQPGGDLWNPYIPSFATETHVAYDECGHGMQTAP